uniref:Maturase K n=1 Tax=Romanomermis culicivorax TaxID=13658 RepID=A0A915HGE4_ROMCU
YFFDWLNVHSPTLSSNKGDYSRCIDLILNSVIDRFEDDDYLLANVEQISRGPNAICTPRKSSGDDFVIEKDVLKKWFYRKLFDTLLRDWCIRFPPGIDSGRREVQRSGHNIVR